MLNRIRNGNYRGLCLFQTSIKVFERPKLLETHPGDNVDLYLWTKFCNCTKG